MGSDPVEIQGVRGSGGVDPAWRTMSPASRPNPARPPEPAPPAGQPAFDQLELFGPPNYRDLRARLMRYVASGLVTIQIVDGRSGALIRELSADEVIAIVRELEAYARLRK